MRLWPALEIAAAAPDVDLRLEARDLDLERNAVGKEPVDAAADPASVVELRNVAHDIRLELGQRLSSGSGVVLVQILIERADAIRHVLPQLGVFR